MRHALAAALMAALPAAAQEAAPREGTGAQDAPDGATARLTVRLTNLTLTLDEVEIVLVLDPEQAARLIDAITAPPAE